MKKLCKLLRNHWKEILNYFNLPCFPEVVTGMARAKAAARGMGREHPMQYPWLMYSKPASLTRLFCSGSQL